MKEEILSIITMKDILDKYNIPRFHKSFKCPFHGEDKHPSAAAYGKWFHCFTCGENLDVIGFVQRYFNLSFKEAMEKINQDFNLGLKSNTKIDYKKIKEIEKQRQLKKQRKFKLQKQYNNLCDQKKQYFDVIKKLNSLVNYKNWENIVSAISDFQTKLEIIDLKLDYIDQLISSR